MNHLTKNTEVLMCKNCMSTHTVDERVPDAYDGTYCPSCGVEGHMMISGAWKDYEFWSVALYEVGQSYGGPEEGGWYYSTGNRILPNKIRVFEDYEEAVAYRRIIADKYEELTARGFSGKLPDEGWPNVRPRYC